MIIKFSIAGTLLSAIVAALGLGIIYLSKHGKIGMPNQRHDWGAASHRCWLWFTLSRVFLNYARRRIGIAAGEHLLWQR